MPADMSGRAALITGAASGIGRASAIAFAAAGASVALVDIDADGLEDTAATVKAAGQLIDQQCGRDGVGQAQQPGQCQATGPQGGRAALEPAGA